jgi:hypothetical protein
MLNDSCDVEVRFVAGGSLRAGIRLTDPDKSGVHNLFAPRGRGAKPVAMGRHHVIGVTLGSRRCSPLIPSVSQHPASIAAAVSQRAPAAYRCGAGQTLSVTSAGASVALRAQRLRYAIRRGGGIGAG